MMLSGIVGWVEFAWVIPGVINPEWSQYIGSNELLVTEYMAGVMILTAR
jgi:hypothetical protein